MSSETPQEVAIPLETLVVIDSLRKSEIGVHKVIVLADTTVKQYLAIWVGPNEGDVILSELQNIPHETTSTIIQHISTHGVPTRVSISDIKDNVYYGTITFKVDDKESIFSIKPSDGIAVAVRLKLPIFVNNTVMHKAGRSMPNRLIRAFYTLQKLLKRLIMVRAK